MNKISKIQIKTGFHPIPAITSLTLIPALETRGVQVITVYELQISRAVSLAMVPNGDKSLLLLSLSFPLSHLVLAPPSQLISADVSAAYGPDI